MARRQEEEDDYMRDIERSSEGDAGEFVAGGGIDFTDFEIPDHEVTYRRAEFGTAFTTTSRFESLTDDAVEYSTTKASTTVFTSRLATEQSALETTQSLRSEVTATHRAVDAEAIVDGEVPDVCDVGYLQVNPSFESQEKPQKIMETLLAALSKHNVESTRRPGWTVTAEEVSFSVHLHKRPDKVTIRIDFNITSGNEMLFLATTDKILHECKSIDSELKHLPDLSFDFMLDWSSPYDELFPGAVTVNAEELELLLEEVKSEHCHPFTRYEAAKSLKDLCQHQQNRALVADKHKEQFIEGLGAMLRDENEDIVRFAIFVIQSFANDQILVNETEFPELSDILQNIVNHSTKKSTKTLATQLIDSIVSPGLSIPVS
uniref:KA1 domain-containing protein n=1 Tax=Globisporangium ultimum (strain ATCC 200006 / CBS 805.95 / DAOM BR144) TaxID=431595 RepID=K3WID4_GLOUD